MALQAAAVHENSIFVLTPAKIKEAIRRLPDSLMIWNLQPAASGSTAHPLS
jgi:hypothetical protein